MATQEGIIQLKGTIGNITFLKTADGFLAKRKTGIDGQRISSDPAFARTRENNAEFGRAGKAAKVLRNAIRILLQDAKDRKVVGRTTQIMVKVVKADSTSVRGLRNVVDGEAELLTGFDFNINATLGSTFSAKYAASINRVTGVLEIVFPPFVPARDIAAPEGSTHYKLVTAGSEIDFEKNSFVTDDSSSGILPLDNIATAALTLTNNVTANSIHPLFLLLGIQFYQRVNGVDYPLKNGSFNALGIVDVNGV
jgi:hypothetical protein